MAEIKAVYVVWDNNNDEMVSIHRTMAGARDAVLNFLEKETGYTADEWKEFADAAGYDNVDEFKDAIRSMPDYDEDLQMRVETELLED